MSCLGINSALNLISSFLYRRSHCVQIGSYFSSFLSTDKGLPQGSVLSALLFSIFINELPDVLTFSKPHMYADDVQNYVGAKHGQASIDDCLCKVSFDFMKVSEWSFC